MEDASVKNGKSLRVTPRTIPAHCSVRNKGALDWSPSGLLAYGCNYSVVVVDTTQLQIIQTLDRHKAPVVVVKWPSKVPTIGEPNSLTDWSQNFPMFLASGDSSGQIIIWNVISGEASHILIDGNKPIQDLLWSQHFDQSEKYLLAIHPPNNFIVWDVVTGTKMWKKNYSEQLLAFDIDPFSSCRLAFLCPDCILLVEDFSLFKCPGSNGRKFYVSSPKALGTPSTPNIPQFSSNTDRSRERLRKLMRDIIVGEAAPRPEEQSLTSLSDCLQISFHRSLRHIICLVYPREVLLVDLRIHHTVAVLTANDRSNAPLQQLLLCRQRDLLLCVYESGSVSGRVRKSVSQIFRSTPTQQSSWNPLEIDLELQYEQRFLTESIRLTKNNKVLAAAIHPLLESRVVILLTDGRLFLYDLSTNYSCDLECLSEMLPTLWINSLSNVTLRLTLSGLFASLSLNSQSLTPSVIRMCPALTLKNYRRYDPFVAIGCSSGAIQICDISTGVVKKELAIHSYAVKGIEWTNTDEFISYAQSNQSALGGWVRNEVMMTNVRTGKATTIRADRGEESPIELIRVSPLKQHFIIVFKDSPPELWDLRHLTLIRTLPKRFPTITTLEWMPSHIHRQSKKSNLEDSDSSPQAVSGIGVKEFFVFSDPDGNLYHLTVDGSVVKDGARLPTPNILNGIVSIAWKNDIMALGDAEGNVAIWEWRTRHHRPLPHARSPVRKLRFAPGKGNMKLIVQYAEGTDVWDVKDNERLGQWKSCPYREHLTVLDADWCSSDKPLLACSDGSIRVFDVTLHQCNSSLTEYAQELIPCPILLPRSAFQAVKTAVQLNINITSKRTDTSEDSFPRYLDTFVPSVSSPNGEISLSRQCLRAAFLFGDQNQIDLWSVATNYLRYFSNKEEIVPLDTNYDILCDSFTYRQMAKERAALYQSKPRAYEQTRQLTRDHLLLDDKDKAIALLLNTDPEHEQFYSNHLLACLSAILQPTGCHGNAHSTLKLVATHLIASGHIWQGVEILILNGQVLDACRYLQANHLWEDSARVAKLLLMDPTRQICAEGSSAEPGDGSEIWLRWATQLNQGFLKFSATLVLISVGAWHRAAELLAQQHQHDSAALLLRSAEIAGLYQPKDETQQEFVHGVYCNFSRILYESGWRSQAQEWASMGGQPGLKLMEELNFLSHG